MLYIVGTPIGNLEDLSYRQAKVLAEAEVVITEDTRSAGILLQKIPDLFKFKVNPSHKLISYHKENEFQKVSEVLDILRNQKDVVLISQAGMPLISDPGYFLVKNVIKEKLPFTVIPGPTASTIALLYSGFDPNQHMFLGFLPKKQSEIIKIIEKMKQVKFFLPDVAFIFYESPNRIQQTLYILDQKFPDIQISISRELTKKFEETLRGSAKTLLTRSYKGEITVILH
jgi:16S rRNA (cytidine1402-2'-O)-methyltransferase